MTDTKLVITVIIILGILFIALSNHPNTKDFFSKFETNVKSPVINNGPINFEISMDLTPINSNVENVDIDIYSNNINLTFDNGGFTSNKNAKLSGYKGAVSIMNKTLVLDGSFEKLESDSLSLEKTTRIKSSMNFENVSLDNFYLDKVDTKSSAVIKTQGVETIINNKSIFIEKPKGLFVISDKLNIKGTAYKISIPEAKILVSG